MKIRKEGIRIKRIIALTMAAFITTGFTGGIVMARGDDGNIERDFVIDVSAPVQSEIKQSPEMDPAITGNGYEVEVSKPKEQVQNKKPADSSTQPTKPAKARGTVKKSVGSDNKSYPVRKEINNSSVKTAENSGQTEERPKADKREFLTFETATGKIFHMIIDRDKDDLNVQLLTEVSEQDLLNMIMAGEEMYGKVKQDKPEKEEVKKEEPKKEPEKKSSAKSYLIILAIAAAVAGGGYYVKAVKPKKESLNDFDDSEIPEDDDFFEDSEDDEDENEKE